MFEWDEVAGSAHVDPTAAVVADITVPAEPSTGDVPDRDIGELGEAAEANGCVVGIAVILVVHRDAVATPGFAAVNADLKAPDIAVALVVPVVVGDVDPVKEVGS